MTIGCAVEGCGNKHAARGWCSTHYIYWRAHGYPVAKSPPRIYGMKNCTVEGCNRPYEARGFCAAHYLRSRCSPSRSVGTSKVRTRVGRADLNVDLIVATYRAIDDIGVSELARLHNTNSAKVKRILIENGITIRPLKQVRHVSRFKAGDLHTNWNPELTSDDRASVRPTTEHNHWRAAVLRRDRFACQSCDASDPLEAHHIESWGTCPEKRFDVSNGITFCRECHFEFHRRFGKQNNNREQLARFIAPATEIAA